MNLARKLELARAAIASITRHDDASDTELNACAVELRTFLDQEMKAAASRRAERDHKRVAALKGTG